MNIFLNSPDATSLGNDTVGASQIANANYSWKERLTSLPTNPNTESLYESMMVPYKLIHKKMFRGKVFGKHLKRPGGDIKIKNPGKDLEANDDQIFVCTEDDFPNTLNVARDNIPKPKTVWDNNRLNSKKKHGTKKTWKTRALKNNLIQEDQKQKGIEDAKIDLAKQKEEEKKDAQETERILKKSALDAKVKIDMDSLQGWNFDFTDPESYLVQGTKRMMATAHTIFCVLSFIAWAFLIYLVRFVWLWFLFDGSIGSWFGDHGVALFMGAIVSVGVWLLFIAIFVILFIFATSFWSYVYKRTNYPLVGHFELHGQKQDYDVSVDNRTDFQKRGDLMHEDSKNFMFALYYRLDPQVHTSWIDNWLFAFEISYKNTGLKRFYLEHSPYRGMVSYELMMQLSKLNVTGFGEKRSDVLTKIKHFAATNVSINLDKADMVQHNDLLLDTTMAVFAYYHFKLDKMSNLHFLSPQL